MNLRETDIRLAWPKIKDQVASILQGDDRPEELYAQCRLGNASLFTADDGFVVLRKTECPDTGEKECLVWVAYGSGENMIQRYLAELREIAKSTGCVALVCRTRREGLLELLGPQWSMRHAEYSTRI